VLAEAQTPQGGVSSRLLRRSYGSGAPSEWVGFGTDRDQTGQVTDRAMASRVIAIRQ
jgi:hypothetical protein